MNTIHTTISMSPDGDSAILIRDKRSRYHECAVRDITRNLAHLFPTTDLLRPAHAIELEELVSRQLKDDGFVEVHLRYEVHEAECWEGWTWTAFTGASVLINGPTSC